MSQQINLYNPLFEKKEKPFSARTMSQALALIAVGVATMHLYAAYQARSAERVAVQLGQQVAVQREQVAKLVKAGAPTRSKSLEAEISRLEAEVKTRQTTLQALNTGHLGSMSTIHANSSEQALTRLAHCVLTANVGLPHRSTREAITLAIHLVVHLARLDAKRVVTEVVRVQNYDPQSDRFVVEAWSPPQAVQEGATA